jgi:8-amino-7-oxononanoate synthase
MDGDVSLLHVLGEVVKELVPAGNAQFLMVNAHTTGVLGRPGEGFRQRAGSRER